MKPDLREQQTKFAMLLQERGPRITEIARELGVYPETARYWFNHYILGRRGVTYQAQPDYEGLGFKRIAAVIDFANEYSPFAREILKAMNRLCYLTYFIRLFPSGYYLIMLSTPSSVRWHYEKLHADLQEIGVYRVLQLDRLDWVRTTPMKARYYNFSEGRWEFDWSAIANEKGNVPPAATPNGSIKYDYEDLRILEKLHVDATRSAREVSRLLKMPYQQGYNHFGHIVERGQISLYRILWPATGPKEQGEDPKVWQQHHAHLGLAILVSNSTVTERQNLLTKAERLPFNWATGGGEETFYSEFVVPLEYYSESFQYLSDALYDSRGRIESHIGDQANSMSFSIPAHLYDSEAGGWTDNPDGTLAKFRNLVQQVRRKH